jgi:hypothetical protein
MKKGKPIQYLGFQGDGETLKEARTNAEEKVRRAMSLDYQPRIFIERDCAGLVWNTPHGPCGALFDMSTGKIGCVTMHSISDIHEAETSMRMHLAMLTANIDAGAIPSIIADRPALVRDFLSWIGFQRAYRAAQVPSAQRHQWACNHAYEFTPVICASL